VQEDTAKKQATKNGAAPATDSKQNGHAAASRQDREMQGEREARAARTDLIQQTRLRQKNVDQHINDEQRKKSQEELLDKKLEQLKRRFENGEIVQTSKKEIVKKMGQI
jgi:hypothetical protein